MRHLLTLCVGVCLLAFGCGHGTLQGDPTDPGTPPKPEPKPDPDPEPMPELGDPPMVSIVSPLHGAFVAGEDIEVRGTLAGDFGEGELRINDKLVDVSRDGSFSAPMAADPSRVVQPIEVSFVRAADGAVSRARHVVLYSDSQPLDSPIKAALDLRLTDQGFDDLSELATTLVGGRVDLPALLPSGTEVLPFQCVKGGPFGTCAASAGAQVSTPEPHVGALNIELTPRDGAIASKVIATGITVNIHVDLEVAIRFGCDIELTADSATLTGAYGLEPASEPGDAIDARQMIEPTISLDNFEQEFVGGGCDQPIIRDVVALFMPDVEELVSDALRNFAHDPDGAGPRDDRIADSIESALSNLDLHYALGAPVNLEAAVEPRAIVEATSGVDLVLDGQLTSTASVQDGPVIDRFVTHSDAPMSFDARSPSGDDYDFGLAIAPSTFNQALALVATNGLLDFSITSFSGAPLTAGAAAAFFPAFSELPKDTKLAVQLTATLPPFVTEEGGPTGTLGEVQVPHLLLTIVNAETDEEYVHASLDMAVGFGLAQSPDGMLSATLPIDRATALRSFVLRRSIGAGNDDVLAGLPMLLPVMLPALTQSLSTIALPTLLGYGFENLMFVRQQGRFVAYGDLSPQGSR